MRQDVIAVNNDTLAVRILANGELPQNAEAIVKMAVMRRGLEEEFFVAVREGRYKQGDKWEGA